MLKGLGVVMIVLLFIVFGWLMFGIRTCSGVVGKVVTPDNIIMNYEWYYNMYNAIDAQKRNIMIMDKSRPERLGAIMVLNNTIAEYNSKSAQISRNLWKSKDLPYAVPMFEENK